MKKMKKIQFLIKTFFIAFAILLTACEQESYEFGDIINPSNIELSAEIVGANAENPNGDGSGVVNFTASADDAITFKYVFDGSDAMAPSGKKTYNFSETGLHIYTVTVVALGTGGVGSSKTVEVEVLALYEPPADLIEMLTGGSEKTWRIMAESPGHFGVGPADGFTPDYWSASPFEKDGVGAYDDTFIFNIDKAFTHVTNGDTFGKLEPMANDLDGDQGREADENGEVDNYQWDDYSESYALTAPGGQETITFSNVGYHGFYVGGDHSYMILSRTDDQMTIRTIGDDGNAWYGILTSQPADPGDPEYTNLVWQDEFDVDGQPNTANWSYDIGDSGWGNGEAQYYTDRLDNSSVAGGVLKITAKAENYEGANYTSARLISKDKFDFTYGRVDVHAKLAGGGGTWPAIWTLGSNFDTVGWPACGEIDIMEYVGNDPGKIGSAIHNTSSSGATINLGSTSVSNETSEFHTYSIIWSENQITFLVDDKKFYTYKPDVKDNATWPFDANQFLILNVAMGGTLGGTIDPGFTESTMEIDYIRVYQ